APPTFSVLPLAMDNFTLSLPLEMVRLAQEASTLTTIVFDLELSGIITASAAVGTPLGLQLLASPQLLVFAPRSQVFCAIAAPANRHTATNRFSERMYIFLMS